MPSSRRVAPARRFPWNRHPNGERPGGRGNATHADVNRAGRVGSSAAEQQDPQRESYAPRRPSRKDVGAPSKARSTHRSPSPASRTQMPHTERTCVLQRRAGRSRPSRRRRRGRESRSPKLPPETHVSRFGGGTRHRGAARSSQTKRSKLRLSRRVRRAQHESCGDADRRGSPRTATPGGRFLARSRVAALCPLRESGGCGLRDQHGSVTEQCAGYEYRSRHSGKTELEQPQ